MPKIHPSYVIKFEVDERVLDESLQAEIRRNFAHAGATVIEPAPARGDGEESTMAFCVTVRRDLWGEPSPEKTELWEEGIVPWLDNVLYKGLGTLEAAGKTSVKAGEEPLAFQWADVRFGDAMGFSFARPPLDKDEMLALMSEARTLVMKGAWGDGVVGVRFPSASSLQEQCAALAGDTSTEATAKADDAEEEGAADDAGASLPEDVDMSVWGIEYADGTVRDYDSASQSFVS